jgi:hypothetical protein
MPVDSACSASEWLIEIESTLMATSMVGKRMEYGRLVVWFVGFVAKTLHNILFNLKLQLSPTPP